MIEIDGRHSGGQSLRSALSLSALTGKPFKIINIRGKREEGGLIGSYNTTFEVFSRGLHGKIKDGD